MQGKILLPLVLAISTLAAGVIGMSAAAGGTALHVVMRADTQKGRIIDHYEDGLRLGDRVAARGPLTDEDGTEVGMGYGNCTVERRIWDSTTGLWNCTYVLELEDGDLILQGLDPRGPGVYEIAVLGGTGAYANASGDATFTDTAGETEVAATEMVIRLNN